MVDTRQFASEPKKDLLGVDGALQPNVVLVNRYRITGVLGVGGMGSVYQARDLQFPNVERYVAVKEMLNLSQDPELRDMSLRNFEREANLLAALSHPAIPTIYDYFSVRDRAYLVMEYINGKDFESILNTVPDIPIEMIVKWGIDVCDVISYLHQHQPPIIFRDIKPANIMIDQFGRLRLIDFGIARTFQVGQKGTTIGTEGYSAPEQYKGEANPGSDIYGVGATLHHALTRHDPRLEPPFTFADRPIRDANPDVSPELEAVVMRALTFEMSQRFVSAEAMKKALEAVLNKSKGLPVVSAGAGGGGSSQATTALSDEWAEASRNAIDVRWKFKFEEEIRSTPTVHQGLLFVGSYDNNLWALNVENGQLRWKFPTDGGVATTPAIAEEENLVIAGSNDFNIYAVDIRSGRQNWKLTTQGPIRSSPTVAHGHVFFGSDDHKFYAVRVATGRAAWKYDAGSPIRSRPALTDELIIFGTDLGDVFALDLSGQLKWRFKTKRSVMSSPVVYEGMVFFGSSDSHLYTLEAKNGWSVWRYRTGKPVISSPVIANGNVHFGSVDGYVYALDASSGRERWKFKAGDQVTSSPAYFNGAIYIGGVDGKVYSIDAKTGKERWSYATGGAITGSPCVSDGMVYIGSTDQHVYALKA
ncbi:MAG: protein kinase [Chloroflexota bacterium]|nr:protein kinase [Chloroflexota bacterium]NOG63161.1 serine/threonine-protein kinase [Chloroflexota bacterium]GIK62973.1 MAG: protein kinase [Chloroflexota bacterium]